MTAGTRPARIAWGLPDAVLCWLAGYFGAILASFPLYAGHGSGDIDTKLVFGIILPAQQLAVVLAVVYVSRLKGQNSLAGDFGLLIRLRDAKALVVGASLEITLTVALYPILQLDPHAKNQQLLTDLKEHRDAGTVVLFVIGAVIFAPVVEELLFRGVLLRSLLRKVAPATAVLVSAVVFALVHYVGDPNTLPFLPALTGLGVVLALVALRTGDLSASIFIHAGFNLTTTLLFLASGAKLS
ncbi:MAG TPA: CPBP family intramembrane glutamic endopeptidase [Acidimicrobiia bacterium]|nr:CPBP family intramembrane glutamic endopeptidase [Acidimicrobiia bacterium]HKN92133.1 CPBP family intramembrane glutamic endopeptidase [Acidimicrobiia bacterium]